MSIESSWYSSLINWLELLIGYSYLLEDHTKWLSNKNSRCTWCNVTDAQGLGIFSSTFISRAVSWKTSLLPTSLQNTSCYFPLHAILVTTTGTLSVVLYSFSSSSEMFIFCTLKVSFYSGNECSPEEESIICFFLHFLFLFSIFALLVVNFSHLNVWKLQSQSYSMFYPILFIVMAFGSH